MALSSGFFQTMISLPKKHDDTAKEQCEHITVSESGIIWKTALDVFYPNRVHMPENISFDLFMDLCAMADKYDMSAVVRILKSERYWNRNPPILEYALACRLGWTDKAKLASTSTLSVDIMSDESQKQLEKVATEDALRLLQLHTLRRKRLIAALDFSTGAIGNEFLMQLHHRACHVPEPSVFAHWYVFKRRVSEEVERAPIGLTLKEEAFWDAPEFQRLWHYSCISCSRPVAPKYALRKALVTILNGLPKTI